MAAKEIVDYASQNLARGYSEDEVKAAMLASGWTEDEAKEAIEEVKGIKIPTKPGVVAVQTPAAAAQPAGAKPAQTGKKGGSPLWIVLILVVLLVVVAAAAVALNLVDVSSIPVLKDVITTPTPPPMTEVQVI